jgi:hypothetical protein
MSATRTRPPETPTGLRSLGPEWERVELLAECLTRTRSGADPGEARLERLAQTDRDVRRLRGDAGWCPVDGPPLTDIEHDLLACALAPDAEPRLGWLFQTLQPWTSEPYPTPALAQELLALDAHDAGPVYAALAPGAPLRRHELLELDGEGPYHAMRPTPTASRRLLGRPVMDVPPPGSVRVPTRATWDDLVLPPDRVAALREFLAWIRHRDLVVERWGGRPGGGPIALFAGPSGTGKTLAAAVVATELGWPLFRVDLGRLVSKYIGETEKNLNRLFDAAHDRDLVLQIDEADSLFGRRGDVRDARDRYANLEVSHLLARIEMHRGPCVLTTNLRGHLDPAFLRRFQVVLEFPRPDGVARTRLWRTLLPPRAPRDDDVELAELGRQVPLTGGEIRNAALHAAFLAADDDGTIARRHLAVAVWRELGKDGSQVGDADLGDLATELTAAVTGRPSHDAPPRGGAPC